MSKTFAHVRFPELLTLSWVFLKLRNITTYCCYVGHLSNSVKALSCQARNVLKSKDQQWHILRSELIINVSRPLTRLTFTFPPAAALSWQLLRSGGCSRPLDPDVIQHTHLQPQLSVCVPEWVGVCVRQTLWVLKMFWQLRACRMSYSFIVCCKVILIRSLCFECSYTYFLTISLGRF